MTLKPFAAAAAVAGLLLAGCQQRDHTAQSTAGTPQMQASTASDTSTSSKDPSLPAADQATGTKSDRDAAATPNTARPNPSPASETGSDASAHSALTPTERDREMPMKGQVNDYNTPDRAKEGDQPNTASKEPGGQEANPGNATRNEKEATQ